MFVKLSIVNLFDWVKLQIGVVARCFSNPFWVVSICYCLYRFYTSSVQISTGTFDMFGDKGPMMQMPMWGNMNGGGFGYGKGAPSAI